MGVVYNFDSLARVLEFAEPTVYNGSWEVIKGGLISSGEIAESAGVVQKVVTINEAASSTATAGETLSALCAMDVSESTVAGATVTTLTPKAAITFTPKTVALCSIAGALGLDFGFRVGQNLVNLYYGDDWDWHAPGIFDAAKDAIRTYIDKNGNTFYDAETITAIGNRLNDIGAFNDGELLNKTIPKNIGWSINNGVPINTFIANWSAIDDVSKQALLTLADHFNIGNTSNIYLVSYRRGSMKITIYNSNEFYLGSYSNNYNYTPSSDFENNFPGNFWYGYTATNGKYYPIPIKTELGSDEYAAYYKNGTVTNFNHIHHSSSKLFNNENGVYFTIIPGMNDEYLSTNLGLEITGSGIDGVNKQDGATVPTTFPLEIPDTYPSWQPSPINKPDGANQTYPVEMPDTDPLADKATKPQNEAQKGINQDPENNPVIGSAILIVQEILPNIPTPQVPTIDDGDTPIPIIPAIGVQGTGFVALYNPTQSQLSAFSQYLWSNDFIENFKKLFSNPMDAIIGLHLIYATPSRGNVAEIVCGYSHSGVMSNTVNNQYIEIDCGSIKVNRYFGNVLDYAPYTKLQVYLPFVGIVDLDTNEIMDGTLNIKYRIDVLTGSCLARLKITRGDYNAELYNFAGNCAVQLPISGGSYSGIIANAIGVAGSLGATIATGGAMAPVLVESVVSSAVNSRTNVSHSGSLGSNAGALGIMKPYLIITRPKPAEANYFNEFYGRPSNKTVRLSSCSGYTRIKDIHIENISSATDDELNEIESLLKNGVII